MLRTNLKVLSGANEQFRRRDAFFLFFSFVSCLHFALPPMDINQGLCGCTGSHLPYYVITIIINLADDCPLKKEMA